MANLLVISGYWPTEEDPISGIFIVEQIRAFTELGHNVWVMVGQAFGRRRRLLSLEDLGLDSASVKLLSPLFIRAPERLSHLPFFFRANVRNTGRFIADAIHRIRDAGVELDGALAQDLRYAIASAPIWSPVLKAPAVGLVHGVDPVLDKGTLDQSILSALKDGLKELSAVGIVGMFLTRHLSGIGLDASQFQLVLNGTEVPANYRSCNYATAGPKRILSVSRLCAWKGVDDTLRALALLKNDLGLADWELCIVGVGEERTALELLAKQLGIVKNVRFVGRLDRSGTLAAFEQCDLFCLPSWAEPFGIVYLEAMARGRPVIGCDNCGPADFVVSGRDGILVPPKDPATLSKALRMLWDNPESLSEIAAEGRRTAEKLTWKRNALQISKLLGF
ncbi:glycosyltransferase family 4 protein [Wenzhouxiangella sp. XN79A]|uniref:glycosyltransferase family 4 protein n=1 Tax=Wenzhouxiangella sp. XN79A TaxID=2724193 RepID=UPI00144ACEB8|nr:glycosyltransferase family 4 protein [Wenzhouxiangella sp. XN79A]NKI36433.1 glycosyltransferase family 4 protein [Wenzhouxiangella sp. XN79A]